MRIKPLLMAVLVVVSVLVPVTAAAATSTTQQSESYSETHVAFDTTSNAIVNYRVNGQTKLESVKVQSKNEADGGLGVDAGLDARTSVDGAGVSVESTTSTRAAVRSESGAEMQAHDSQRGILVVTSGGQGQYVNVNLSSDAEANQASERKVVVTHGDGSEGAFMVVGDGELVVNERGNVSSELGSDGRLVYRSYDDGRDDEDESQEELITSGRAAAEVYMTQAEDSGSDGQEQAADVAHYSQDTTVEVVESSEGRLEMTAERSQSEGRVIITTVSEEAFGSAQDVNVTVDGEAAAEASSYGELESATQNGDQSRYMVRQSSSAEATADVLVAVNHFSERNVAMTSGGSDGGDGMGASQPGFGVLAVLAAIAALLVGRLHG